MQADVTMTLSELRELVFNHLNGRTGYQPRNVTVRNVTVIFNDDNSMPMIVLNNNGIDVLAVGSLSEST